jgi:hypothetical protein
VNISKKKGEDGMLNKPITGIIVAFELLQLSLPGTSRQHQQVVHLIE